jgi:hypothetical protein
MVFSVEMQHPANASISKSKSIPFSTLMPSGSFSIDVARSSIAQQRNGRYAISEVSATLLSEDFVDISLIYGNFLRLHPEASYAIMIELSINGVICSDLFSQFNNELVRIKAWSEKTWPVY